MMFVYKITLDIKQADPLLENNPKTYSVSYTGTDLFALKSRANREILRMVEESGEYDIEMNIECNGEFSEHEEWTVKVDVDKLTVVNSEDLSAKRANVKFIFILNSGKEFVHYAAVTKKQFNEVIDCIDSSFLNSKSAVLRLGDCIISLSDCSVVTWEIMHGWEILYNE